MAGRNFKPTQSNLSMSSDGADSQIPPLPLIVTFGRRTSSGHYISYSRDDLDSEIGSTDLNYTVHIPPTPDNNPMDVSRSQNVKEQYMYSSLFTGGFNSVTRAHLMDKVIEFETSHSQTAGAKGSYCAIHGCDAKVMTDERGVDILPCECDFNRCRDCYIDAVKTGGGICPGCKEPYKNLDLDEVAVVESRRPLQLPPPAAMSKTERRLSLMKSTKSGLMRSQTGDSLTTTDGCLRQMEIMVMEMLYGLKMAYLEMIKVMCMSFPNRAANCGGHLHIVSTYSCGSSQPI